MTSDTLVSDYSSSEVATRLQLLCKNLDSANEILLPTDYPRPVPLKVVEAAEEFTLPPQLSMNVLQLILQSQQSTPTNESATTEMATPFTVLLTAFVILLYRFTASEDIVVGSASENSNPLVLRLRVSPTDSFMQVMQNVRKVEKEAYENQVPFDDLIKAVATQLSKGRGVSVQDSETSALYSLFRVRFFNATDTTDSVLKQTISPSTDLTVFISQESTTSLRQLVPSINIRFVYNQVLFSKTRIHHIWEQLQKVLSVALESSSPTTSSALTIGAVDLLSDLGKSSIPNPTDDLHWSEYPGPITEIFHKNTTSHPDRPLITEYNLVNNPSQKSLSSKKVVFSYLQMYTAARVVSRFLRSNGIQVGDVVIIYAYRSADLLVAIMGVLMSGATFSVIDPAYPPARQNIYLSVAKPRGVIVLDKAGSLHQDVQQYIKDELDLGCTLDTVSLNDNGVLESRTCDLSEIKRSIESNPFSDEDVVQVGPDSVGTLSFTSGSTGIPKGVQGRHFSLTHFYPWMQREFGIGPDEKFTMLSGIAHDPIQRDIFTPIFFGAQLIVPTSEDIGIPGKLAEWMSINEISVTHLTPAMGQLLSSNAITSIPTLKNAFFVGDLLTRRDCNRIQSIAPNCRIINMYGTTETQRAVSYYPIPPLSENPAALSSMKEIIPAGKGMIDVQLLVVNVHNKNNLCAVGEIGEIYVRSSGLAEGYLRLEDATKEKFVYNWFSSPQGQSNTSPPNSVQNSSGFYLGPRDRLYRTGDLGRYTPNGNVECIGRIDDQVKIRGFRIELGEINNILSLFPQLVASVVLVRRDKNEEQTLVAYIVPDEQEQKRKDDPSRENLISNIRNYLKQKLPSYAIPSVFVPMKKLPLTPNGKIDKAALPFPDTPMFRASKSDSTIHPVDSYYPNVLNELGPTGQKLLNIWASLLDLAPGISINRDSNFFDLGGHSILATRMVFRIRKELAEEAPLGMVYQSPTLYSMTVAINDIINDNKLSNPLQQISGQNSPTLQIKTTDISSGTSENLQVVEKSSYSEDYESLRDSLSLDIDLQSFSFPFSNDAIKKDGTRPVFLVTGVTGFLGAYILSRLFERHHNAIAYCLTRAKDASGAFLRIKTTLQTNFVWNDSWEQNGNIRAVVGDLGLPMLGMDDETWDLMSKEVDVIIHNGALVNWVWPYEKLRAPNVLGTVEAIKLATADHTKPLVFVSSTSVLDVPHYVQLAEARENGVSEDDDLESSRFALRSGYGQSKWVAEKLLFYAKSKGYPFSIVRPGYVLGDSVNGVTNTDDFIWRLVKGCIELGISPEMNNVVNLCPVDYVAKVVVEAASLPSSLEKLVYHVYNKQKFKFQDLFDSVSRYGYELQKIEYIKWRDNLLSYTVSSTEDTALFPLLHFVLDDLPTSTRAPELDTANTDNLMSTLKANCPDITGLVGLYLSYLVKAGFLPQPKNSNAEQRIPEFALNVDRTIKRNIG
ncbi:hypothetical protein BB560_001095 [Smittium megazygosporum]|uniref:Alpha-aminoadipate reductase n=1 Tax=Smittium megazygosporum TaxID=133381 RepID=A0A2T9ZIH1_9FUNG|nr:hypothetical protein BB560_001095 [Smittium megazygosporum]